MKPDEVSVRGVGDHDLPCRSGRLHCFLGGTFLKPEDVHICRAWVVAFWHADGFDCVYVSATGSASTYTGLVRAVRGSVVGVGWSTARRRLL